jgi:dihydrodipicolinate synthase/N-acetylneuraminate lyase
MDNYKLGHGVIVPMVTPVTANHEIDLAGVSNLINHIITGGAAPFILGTTGESASIAEDDRSGFVKKMVDVAGGRSHTYAGVSSPSLKTSVHSAKQYFDLGVDAVVAHPPAYYPLSDDQLFNYFETLADAIPGPLIIYNITSVTHISIPVKIIDKLSHHKKIIGVKDSERDLERFETSIKLWANRNDFVHLVGWGTQMADSLKKGSNGLVPSTGNVTPKEYVDMMHAAESGDDLKLNELQVFFNELGAVYQKNRSLGDSLAALKVMLNELGLCDTYMMPPLNRLDPEDENRIRSEMKIFDLKLSLQTD